MTMMMATSRYFVVSNVRTHHEWHHGTTRVDVFHTLSADVFVTTKHVTSLEYGFIETRRKGEECQLVGCTSFYHTGTHIKFRVWSAHSKRDMYNIFRNSNTRYSIHSRAPVP
jgi:hypothetical protein